MGRLTHARAGMATISGPGQALEYETCTCRHCNRVWCTRSNDPKQPGDLGGFCRLCQKMICSECVGKPCKPFEKRLEEMEARGRALASYGV